MKKLLFAFLYKSGIIRIVSWCNRRRVMILCYHSVTERLDTCSDDPHKQHLHRNLFISQLDYLRRNYQIIPLREFLAAIEGNRPLPSNSVVLTFDDGLRNLLTVAAPVLAEHRVPATAFIITDRTSERSDSKIDSRWTASDDETHLSWAEVSKLEQEYGIEIGSHSCSHPQLNAIHSTEAWRELSDSYGAIAAHLKHDTIPLAYPHGQTSEEVSEQAKMVGYTCALTGYMGANGMHSALYQLQRTVIAADDELATFAARVSGLTWWFNSIRLFFGLPVKRGSKKGVDVYNKALLDQTDA